MSVREKLRTVTIGAPSSFQKEVVEWEGEEFEVRQPSVEQRAKLFRKANVGDEGPQDHPAKGAVKKAEATNVMQQVDMGLMQVWATIECVYIPGTDENVFSPQDVDALLKQPSGGFVDQFATVAMDLMNVRPEEDAKNS